MNIIEKVKKLEKIKFNSAGQTNVELPRQSIVVLSWPFQPIDLDQIL